MRVGDLALWKDTSTRKREILVLITRNGAGLNRHYYCQVIEDGSIYVLTQEVLEPVCK